MKPATSKRRLLALVKLLRELPRKRFDYARWVGTGWKGKPDLSCGTSACALGWATTIPALQREGLRLVGRRNGSSHVVLGRLSDIFAGAKAFGITPREATLLFIPGSLVDGAWAPWSQATPKQVAAHIEKFAKAKFGSVR